MVNAPSYFLICELCLYACLCLSVSVYLLLFVGFQAIPALAVLSLKTKQNKPA